MTRPRTDARERIITAAYDLFYRQGYQATTVDQVIEQSGVSRPTVYSYFSTKEDLCVEYVKRRREKELELIHAQIAQAKTDRDKFMAIIRFVADNVLSPHFRGCGFYNMISEIPDHTNKIITEAKLFVNGLRELIRKVVSDIKISDPKYSDLDVNGITDSYFLIICGAIMAGQEYRERWPVDSAIRDVDRLLPE